ncbi:MAG TPA: GGDEF domain-containing phosphodiesterase [Nitrosomonas mobilis]|nr:GGDEF domain-containing phosphodiesterase [Nitrosomonas mobilis]
MPILSYLDFLQAANHILLEPQRVPGHSAMLLVEFERLPELDGVLGYRVVDDLVSQAARTIRQALNPADIIGAIGRHQIACLLANLLTDEHARLAAYKIQRTLAQPVSMNGHRINLFCRIGIAVRNPCNHCTDQLMRTANLALHGARAEHESIKLLIEQSKDSQPVGIDLLSDLEEAIETGEIFMVYQPKFDIASGRITSTESLLRWTHPQQGAIRPDKLIQLVESTPLMTKLTLWIMNTALRQCAEYRRAGLDAGVSINFSAEDLRDPELTELVMQSLALWQIPAEVVTIELTETAVMENDAHALQVLERFKEIGLKLSMDDFGTGYSSMARLLQVPLDEIKIDMLFVKNMLNSRMHERIVDTMINLGHQLGLRVVAEGVEDEATFARLQELGCDTVQGYLIGRGMLLPELIQLARNQTALPTTIEKRVSSSG